MSCETSMAGQTAKVSARRVRDRILEELRRRGPTGATDIELQAALELSGDTQRPRRQELQLRGLVVDSGIRRPTPRGHTAVVWAAAREQAPLFGEIEPPPRTDDPACERCHGSGVAAIDPDAPMSFFAPCDCPLGQAPAAAAEVEKSNAAVRRLGGRG
jgi:hypothetical protein